MIHDVAIIKEPDDGPYRVIPGALLASPDDLVFFHNFSDKPVTIEFGANRPLNTDVPPTKAGEKTLAISVKADAHGPYFYNALCDDGTKKALGSVPVIIIYPRR
jgi:hypothetical protein